MTARHVVLFAFAGGLLAGGWAPPAALPLAIVAAAVVRRRVAATVAVAAVVLGTAAGDVRREAIDSGRLPARIGAVVRGEVTLLERLRARASGERVAAVAWRGGWADGQRLLLEVRGGGGSPAPGARLLVAARVRPLAAFDTIQRRRGAAGALEAVDWRATGDRRGGVSGVLDAVRGRAEAGLEAGLPAREAALLRGMVLGQDDAIAPAVREDFRASGLAHLLAVSGTNVMLLATLVLAAFALTTVPLRWRLATALALVALYVPLAGAGASIQRAGIMGAAGLVAALAGRPSSRWYALGLAAAGTLLLNPYAAAEPGWQLSFAAVAGLLALAPRLSEALEARRVPRPLAEAAAMTIAATVATAPLLAVHFDRVSLVSLPANLVAAPVVAPIMWLGMLAGAAGQVAAAAALPLNLLNAGLVSFLGWLAHAAASAPLADVRAPLPAVACVYALAGLAYALRHRLPRPPAVARAPRAWAGAGAAAALAALAFAAGGGPAPPRPGETVVSFLDVGQGDATLVQRDGASLLVDTGPPGGPVVERLRAARVQRLDVLLITHAQADHEGAAPEVIARFRPRLVLNGGAGWRTRVQAVVPRSAHVPVAGQSLRLGPMHLRFLWPPRALMEAPPEGDANDRAVVAHLRVGDFDLLLPADAESPVTGRLRLPRVEALKVAHHGSEDPGLPALLQRIRPAVAAIEVGRGNRYGHPRPQTLAALRPVPRVFRTDRDGTIRLRVRGGRMTFERDGGWR